MSLWDTLAYFVETGREGRKVDLKRELNLETKTERARFAKDVLAMANTTGGTGYLVIGVLDARERTSTNPDHYILGFTPGDADALQCTMSQSLQTYCDPVPDYRYEEVTHPGTGRRLGVVIIPRSFAQPHVAKVDGEGLRAGDIYVRRGPATFPASREELRRMFDTRGGSRILVSFSGKPITDLQMRQLQDLLGAPIYEVITVPHELDDAQPYGPQMQEKVRQANLTAEEWASLPLLVNVHPLAPATADLLGIMHGLMGHFPDVLRLRRIGSTNEFEVAEVLRPQSLRDLAARKGI